MPADRSAWTTRTTPGGDPRRKAKRAAYRAARLSGLFATARRLTANQLRILCYHGVTDGDLPRFEPGLFMTPATFRRRLEVLADTGDPVLPLGEAVAMLGAGTLPPRAVVITIDDGFEDLARFALPALQEFGFDATVYVTSYYADVRAPIYTLALQYMLWLTDVTDLSLDGLATGLDGNVTIASREQRWIAFERLDAAGRALETEDERSTLAAEVGRRLGLDYDAISASRQLHLLDAEAIQAMAAAGVDVQLHTHRHRLPDDQAAVRREIDDNRAWLEPLVGRPLHHLCYPSGIYEANQLPWLQELDIVSGTTCLPGLNDGETPRLELRRFLDSEDVHEIEFEAELAGLGELMRRGRASVSGRRR